VIQVFHYIARNGRDPFGEWLSKQSINVVARIQQRIDRMSRGNFGDHRRLDSGLSELRIDYGPGYRVYYGRDGHNIVILLAGGTKKSQDPRY
jgi:putative addiction module killer protein